MSIALFNAAGPACAEEGAVYARLTNLHGTVLVDTGLGFAPVVEGVGLELGDRVLVADGGGALLDFGDDCTLPLDAPSMTTVAETACTTTTQEDGGDEGAGPGTVAAALVGLAILGAGGYALYRSLTGKSMSP